MGVSFLNFATGVNFIFVLLQVYKVLVSVGRNEWFVLRRYAEFDKLYNTVSKRQAHGPGPGQHRVTLVCSGRAGVNSRIEEFESTLNNHRGLF